MKINNIYKKFSSILSLFLLVFLSASNCNKKGDNVENLEPKITDQLSQTSNSPVSQQTNNNPSSSDCPVEKNEVFYIEDKTGPKSSLYSDMYHSYLVDDINISSQNCINTSPYLYNYYPNLLNSLPTISIKMSEEDASKYSLEEQNSKFSDSEYVESTFTLKSTSNSSYNLSSIPCYFKARGSSSAKRNKQAFRIKFSQKQSLCGLNNGNKFKSWVLLADWLDDSMLKNVISFYLGKNLSLHSKTYCSDFIPVYLYINSYCRGIYLLAEHQSVNKNRVNIDDIEKREPEGSYSGTDIGYFFEYDHLSKIKDDEKFFYISYKNGSPILIYNYSKDDTKQELIKYNTRFSSKSQTNTNDDNLNLYTLKHTIYSNNQRAFIRNYMENLYILIYDAIYKNSELDNGDLKYYKFNDKYTLEVDNAASNSYEVINKYIAIDSFVDAYILNEITCNKDYGLSSFYFSVDFSAKGDKKLRCDAPWDFDLSYNYSNSWYTSNPNCYFTSSLIPYSSYTDLNQPIPFLAIFANCSWFQEKVKERYKYMLDSGLLFNSLHYVDTYSSKYERYYKKEWEIWDFRGNKKYKVFTFDNQKLAKDCLYDFLLNRYNWLNKTYLNEVDLITYTANKYKVYLEKMAKDK